MLGDSGRTRYGSGCFSGDRGWISKCVSIVDVYFYEESSGFMSMIYSK